MRVLAIFCAAFAAGVALSQYLLSAQWALILCGVFAAAALVMGLCGCANKRGDWAKRAFLCALGLCFAFGYNTLYAHFIKAPNDALLGTQDTVKVELLGYAEETSHGAKVTVKILNRGLPGRAIYYGDADLMDLEPGAHVTAEALFNSATDPTGKGLHLRNFTAKGVYILLYQRGDPTYDDTNAGALKYLPQRIARTLGETIERSYSEREGAFLRALLLGDKKYLDQAQKVYNFIFNNKNLPEDLVPYWDYDAPNIPNEPRDASAAACTASALYELDGYLPGNHYKETADKIMESLGSPAYRAKVGTNGNFILMHSVGSIPHGQEIDVPLNYADYYFLEGLMRKRDLEKK